MLLVLQPYRTPGNSVLYFELNMRLQICFIARSEVLLEVLLKKVLDFTSCRLPDNYWRLEES